MPATFAQVRDGLAANVASLGVTVFTKRPLTFPTPPFLWIRPPDGSEFLMYNAVFGDGWGDWTMIVEAVHGAIDAQTAEANFNTTFWSALKPAIESDKRLGGVAQDLTVTGIQNYLTSATPENAAIVGAEWVVEIKA